MAQDFQPTIFVCEWCESPVTISGELCAECHAAREAADNYEGIDWDEDDASESTGSCEVCDCDVYEGEEICDQCDWSQTGGES